MMRHGSLFSGIGGFDLAAQRMGWENVFHCEINPFCQKVLKHYWPNAKTFTDIKNSDFSKYANIDVLTGGFPCQPYSTAGKRLGTADDRHLWPYMLATIRQIKPRWIVGENVSGLISWNGGLVFDEVQFDLEAEGYEVQSFVLPAASINAPHRRDRVWIVAHANDQRGYKGFGKIQKENGQVSERHYNAESCDAGDGPASNANSAGSQEFDFPLLATQTELGSWIHNAEPTNWENFPTQSPICGGDDGLSTKLDGITFSKWRNESIKAYGNAVVPQLVFRIFQAIEAYESQG